MTFQLHHGSLQATARLEVWGWVFLAWFFLIALFPQLAGQPYHRLSGQAHRSERARLLFLSWITLALMEIGVTMGTVLALQDDQPMGKWASLGLAFTALLGCLRGEKLGMSSLSLPPAARTLRPGVRIARVMILKLGVLVLLVMIHANSGRPWIGMAPPIIGPVAMSVLVVDWVLDAGGYAQALERIYEANFVPATLAQRTTHPDL